MDNKGGPGEKDNKGMILRKEKGQWRWDTVKERWIIKEGYIES